MKKLTLLIITVLIISTVIIACKGKTEKGTMETAQINRVENTSVVSQSHNGVKLPLQFDNAWGLAYDDQNRVINFRDNNSIRYHEDGSVTINYDYGDVITLTKDGNKISEVYDEYTGDVLTYSDYSFTINREGFITQSVTLGNQDFVEAPDSYTVVIDYVYQNGNLQSSTIERYVYNHSDTYNWKNAKKLTTYNYAENKTNYKSFDDKNSPFYNDKTPKWLLQYLFGISSGNKNNLLIVSFDGKTDENSSNYSENYEYVYDNEGFPIKRTMTPQGTSWDNEPQIIEISYQ